MKHSPDEDLIIFAVTMYAIAFMVVVGIISIFNLLNKLGVSI